MISSSLHYPIIMKFLNLIIVISFCACTFHNTTTENYEIIYLDDKVLNIQEFESCLKDVELIIPESSRGANFGYVFNIAFHDSLFYILDNGNKYLQVFNLNGKHVYKLHRLGKGPGEYLEIKQFDIDSAGNIYILAPGKIIVYESDFKLKEEIRVENSSYILDICFNDLDNLFTHNTKILKNKESFALTKFNSRNIEKFMPLEYKSRFIYKYFNRKSDNEFFYNPGLLSNKIYSIKQDTIKLKYIIQSQDPFLTIKDVNEKKTIRVSTIDVDKYHTISNIHDLDKLLYFNIRKGKGVKTAFYDKMSKKAAVISSNRLSCGIPIFICGRIVNENTLIGIFDPSSIINTEFQADRLIDKKELDLLEGVSISNNPLIVLFKF